MRRRKSLLACLAGTAVVATVVGCPPLLELLRTARDGPGPRDGLRHLQSEHERSKDLDVRMAEVRRCRLLKEEVVAAVVARRLSLLEAAAAFHRLDEQLPGHNWEVFRRALPGDSDEERYCWEVIRYVEGFLTLQPSAAERERERLEAELRKYMEPGGPLHPAPRSADGRSPE